MSAYLRLTHDHRTSFVLSGAHAFNASSSSLRSLPLSRSPTLSVALISYCCALAAVVHSLSLSLCSNCSVTAAATATATACLIVAVVVAVGAAGRLALPSSDTDTDIILAIALSLALVLLVSCVLFCFSVCAPQNCFSFSFLSLFYSISRIVFVLFVAEAEASRHRALLSSERNQFDVLL